MSDRIRLEDPAFEPTDEQLVGLSARAFAHVPEENARLLKEMRERIERAQAELRAEIERRRSLRREP